MHSTLTNTIYSNAIQYVKYILKGLLNDNAYQIIKDMRMVHYYIAMHYVILRGLYCIRLYYIDIVLYIYILVIQHFALHYIF